MKRIISSVLVLGVCLTPLIVTLMVQPSWAKSQDSQVKKLRQLILVFDIEQDHYQILDVGWEGYKRIYNCFIHLDIKDGKIWIQRNMKEADLGQ